ncbi:MAG TPA: MFS transporter [Burkholderiales bacterium]|nr:MFS transporter [Burkholderiales bacterium]
MSIYTVFAIVLCNMSSYRASKVLISLFAIELGASQIYIGVLVAMYAVFPMLMALYAGRLCDRLGMRLPMICGSLGISCGMLLPSLSQSVPALYGSAALIGASHVFYNVSVQNLVGILGRTEDRTRNFSNYGLVMSVGSFLGPLAAGFGIDHFGHARTYSFLSLMPLLAIAILFSASGLRGLRSPHAKEARTVAGARELLSNAPLRRTLIASGVVLTGTDLFQFYMPIYGHSIDLSASAIGMILALFAAAAFIVRLWLPQLAARFGEERMLTWCLFLGGLMYLVFPLFSSGPLLAAAAFVLGLALGSSQPLSMTLTFGRAPQGRSGEALGMRLTINNFMHIAVPLVFGTIGSAFGVAPVFLANSAMLASGGVLTHRSERRAL